MTYGYHNRASDAMEPVNLRVEVHERGPHERPMRSSSHNCSAGQGQQISAKGQIVTCFRLCRPFCLSHNYSTLTLFSVNKNRSKKQPQTICK